MEMMIARWIRETVHEFEKAKITQNYYRMHEMKSLKIALGKMRDELTKSIR